MKRRKWINSLATIALVMAIVTPIPALAQGVSISVRSVATTDPGQCQPTSLNIVFNRATPALKLCTAANTWASVMMSNNAVQTWVNSAAGDWNPTSNNAYSIGNGLANAKDINLTRKLNFYNGTATTQPFSLLNNGTNGLDMMAYTAAPTALTAALVAVAGNVDTGNHSYKVTFVTAGGETEGGTTSNVVANDTAANGQNAISAVPVGNQFVTQRKIYRNKVADQTHWFLQQTIANNTATTGVQDNTADTNLTTAMPTTNTALDTRATIANNGIATFTNLARTDVGNTFVGTQQVISGTGDGILEIKGGGTNQGFIRYNDAGQYMSFSSGAYTNDQWKYLISGYESVTAAALTAGTLTVTNRAEARTVVHRFDWTNAMVVALGAVANGDITICTLPAKTVVRNAYVVIDTTAGGVTTLTVAVGRTGAGYIDYIVASDAKAAANTVYGDTSGERGTNLTGYDLPSYTATTNVKAHFIATVQTLDATTTSTGHIYIETEILP